MKINWKFFEKYPWAKTVEFTPRSKRVTFYTTFDPYVFEDTFNVKRDKLTDIDYFKVGDTVVRLSSDSFFIETKNENEISKVLECIDNAYQSMIFLRM